MFDSKTISMLLEGIRDTLYMTFTSTLFGYLFGLPLGVVLCVTGKDGLKPNTFIYRIIDVCHIKRNPSVLIRRIQ